MCQVYKHICLSSFVQIALNPLLILFNLKLRTHTYQIIRNDTLPLTPIKSDSAFIIN
jgi:hypothetical protein